MGANGVEDPALLLEILKRMATIRTAEQYVAKRYPEGTMRCPTHLCVGQESTAAVFGTLARKDDAFLGNYRSHGHYLAKGGPLVPLLAEILGKRTGCSGGLGGSMHLHDRESGFYGSSAIVGATVPIAAGIALSMKRRGSDRVAVVFFGDAAMEEGVVYETASFAVLHSLPIVFVCENNGLAINTPLEVRSPAGELWKRFEPLGLRGERVLGADVPALVRAARGSLERARTGTPTFVECTLSRYAAHVGHAIVGPVDAWWQDPASARGSGCPIARLVEDLVAAGTTTLEAVRALREEAQRAVEAAFAEAATHPVPDALAVQASVYAGAPLSTLPTVDRKLGVATGEHREPSRLVNPF